MAPQHSKTPGFGHCPASEAQQRRHAITSLSWGLVAEVLLALRFVGTAAAVSGRAFAAELAGCLRKATCAVSLSLSLSCFCHLSIDRRGHLLISKCPSAAFILSRSAVFA